MQEGYRVVLVTAKDVPEARKIAGALLTDKLAACVNIVKDVESLFWWDGQIDSSAEALLVVKTHQSKMDALKAKIRALHSYDVPEIIAFAVQDGSKDYLDWIQSSLQS